MSPSRFRVFVAMPGSMPSKAAWTDVNAIKDQLYGELEGKLASLVGRPVKIVIETDKVRTGDIYDSMWREAREADAYIADLTGANANVYVELGVRWALSDGPTVLICQHGDDGVRFNAQNVRVIRYGPKFDQVRDAVDQIAGAIADAFVDGRARPNFCDSPVLSRMKDSVVSRELYEELLAEKRKLAEENERLKEEGAGELLRAAMATRDLDKRISLLRTATERAEGNETAWYRLGMTLLEVGRNAEAADALDRAVHLAPGKAELWLQLAIARSRGGELIRAEAALAEALQRDPENAGAWATRGGNYRRLARKQGTALDWDLMTKARDAYQKATTLQKNDSYLELNVAQLDLLLSRRDPGLCEKAADKLRIVETLVSYEIEHALTTEDANGVDYWNPFKIVTIQALTGRYDEAVEQVAKAVEPIPPAARRSYVESTIGPLEDVLAAAVLEQPAAEGLQRVISALKQAADL